MNRFRGDQTAAARLRRHGWRVTEPGRGEAAKMTDVDLAAAHLGYGTGGHDEIDAEFWRRFPILAGWHSAMEWLGSEQTEQWHAANGGFDPMGDLAPVSAQYQQLLEKYRTMVQEVVDGATQEAGEA